MGYYINQTTKGGLPAKGKVKALKEDGAIEVSGDTFVPNMVCVVDNGPFEAAAYAYSEQEYKVFKEPDHHGPSRPRTWLQYEPAAELSGYLV